jgi:trimeric autotransporter adhesin
MKWIGQHIYDLVARFRNDVYLEDLSTTTETNVLVVDSTGKVSKTTVITGDVTGVTAGSNITVTDPTGPVPTVALSTNVDVAGTLDVTSLGTFDASVTVAGDVGIGTASPDEKLHVLSSTNTVARFETSLTSDMAIELKNSQGSMFFGLGGSEEFAIGTDADLNGPNSKFVVKPSGNVGIGTTNPGTKLHVLNTNVGVKSIYATAIIENTDSQLDLTSSSTGTWGSSLNFIEGNGATNTNIWSIARTTSGGGNNLRFNFGTNNQHDNDTKMVIESGGNVGIGTTSPAQKLDVVGKISLKDAGDSIFVGYQAGLNDDASANLNVGVGYQALRANTTGANNSAVGYQALYSNTTGIHNTAVGYSALRYNTTGSNNTAVGRTALYLNTTGASNSAVGYQALYNNTASNQTAAGFQALYYNTIGGNNTAHGYRALHNNTTVVVALGTITGGSGYTDGTYTSVLMTYVSGSTALTYPTATIVVAGGVVTTVTLTSFGIGFKDTTTVLSAAAANIGGTGSGFTVPVATISSGDNNTAIGLQALYANKQGDGNTAAGTQAMYSNTTASNNTAIGLQALYSNTTGASNSAHGNQALYSNTTGANNVAVGMSALQTNTTGANNSAVGRSALYQNTTGSNNTSVGIYSSEKNTTGTSNAALGYAALYENTTGNNNIAVGINAGRFIADGTTANTVTSNSVFLGYNTKALATGQTNQIVIGDAAVGLGSNTAILGNSSITKTQLQGKVGIGTSSPNVDLQIGEVYPAVGVPFGELSIGADNASIYVQGGGYGAVNTASLDLVGGYANVNVTNSIRIKGLRTSSGVGTNGSRLDFINMARGTEGDTLMSIVNSGKVGIGTTAPVNKLEIQNTTSVAGGISKGEYPLQLTNTGTGNTGVTGIAFSSQSDDTDIKSAIVFKGSTNGYNRGDIQFLMNSASDNTNVAVDTSAVLTIKDSGNVGIGTTSPASKLQVYTGNTANANNGITLMRGAGFDVFGIKHRSDAGGIYRGAITYDAAEVMTFLINGNVGIGTTTPTQKLDVEDGFIQVSGTGPSGYGYLLNRAGQDIYSIRHLDSGLTISNETDSRKEMTFNGTGNVGIGITTPKNKLDIAGSLGRGIPVTKTANFGVAATENWLIMNGTATITITLPTASSWTGRELMIKNIAAYTVVSASSNVKPIDTDTAATAILPATAGSWCTLVSDGTNWVTMMN